MKCSICYKFHKLSLRKKFKIIKEAIEVCSSKWVSLHLAWFLLKAGHVNHTTSFSSVNSQWFMVNVLYWHIVVWFTFLRTEIFCLRKKLIKQSVNVLEHIKKNTYLNKILIFVSKVQDMHSIFDNTLVNP